jgi:hypothetical protein
MLVAGLLSVLLLFGLFVMHAIGLHGSAAGHVPPAAQNAGSMTSAEQHLIGPTTGTSVEGTGAASHAAANEASAGMAACVAILLLTVLISLPRFRLLRGWASPCRPALQPSRRRAMARRPAPLFQTLCISRT